MQNAYQLQSPVAQRGTQSFGLAPTASMIDPSLTHHQPSFPHVSQAFGANPMATGHSLSVQNRGIARNTSPDRSLPSRDVTDETLDEAYVQFVLYCNPAIPSNVDATELKRGFRSLPKSDGKNFNTFVLYDLISRLERKDIKTWTQLVVELGVELPDTSKNQSTQKVQQYAVRLKVLYGSYYVRIRPDKHSSMLGQADHFQALAARLSRRCILPILDGNAQLLLHRHSQQGRNTIRNSDTPRRRSPRRRSSTPRPPSRMAP